MSAKSNQQTIRAIRPNFCANCGTRFPRLNSQQLATHRFCSCCGKPVNFGTHEWLPVTLNEATGNLVHAEVPPLSDSGGLSIKERLENFGRNPVKMIATGTGAMAIGGGLIFAAAPLAAFGIGVAAAGIFVVKTAIVGGIVTGIVAAKAEDRQAVMAMFKVVGVAAAVGLATVVVGGMIGLFAALFPLLGGLLIGAGALATAGTIGHQAYLQNQLRKQLKIASESMSLGMDVGGVQFPNLSQPLTFLRHEQTHLHHS
jgi:hypothetical protein